jgi:hypothetical protein
MKQRLRLENLKPQSINSMYYGTGSGYTKTSEAKRWTMEVFFQLSLPENQAALRQLRETFDPQLHAFAVRMSATYPESIFMTKKGTVSSKTQDLSNWEKPLIDCLFLPKFNELSVPEGVPNINADDKYVVLMESRKQPGDCYQIDIEVEILPIEQAYNSRS